MKRCGIMKIAALTCGIFAALCIILILSLNFFIYEKTAVFKVILDIIAAAGLILLFLSIKNITLRFSGRIIKTILILISMIILIYGIISTPYIPCHDALDVHNILNDMINGKRAAYYETYMNFWINNKLTVYCYLPFALFFKNAETGARVLNGILITASVFQVYFSVRRFSKGKCGETALVILSSLAPYVLLTGPYIYLPSIFLASAALFSFSLGNRTGNVLFYIFIAVSFVLRPTCAGFILAFFTLQLFLCGRKKCWKNILCVIFAVCLCFSMKVLTGNLLYKTGVHKYPSMLNSASTWTFELGTRPNGIKTGTCSYTPFSDTENSDDIQKDFNTLWHYYYDDMEWGTNSYRKISGFQNELKRKIFKRTFSLTLKQITKNLLYKSGNLFGSFYMPYYCKANVNDYKMDISDNLNVKYFLYQDIILLIFFLCMIINAVRVFKNTDFSKGLISALGLSAFAVIIVFLLLTEVSKKYMFDFFVPMSAVTALTLTYPTKRKNTFASAAAIAASVTALILAVYTCRIPILKNAGTRLIKSGEACTFIIELQKICNENYTIKGYDGEIINLKGKKSIALRFPDDCFNAFSIYFPNGEKADFSSQLIR